MAGPAPSITKPAHLENRNPAAKEPISQGDACPCATTGQPEDAVPPASNPQKSAAASTAASELNRLSTAENPKVKSLGSPKTPSPDQANKGKLRVLILGDSLALCGFGKTLDSHLRNHPAISAVSTFMACGTLPSSWLKSGPYATVRTACGFWSIEGETGVPPAESVDVYGMTRGHKPSAHPVPKLETLLESFDPHILVLQCGTNLLGVFADGKTLLPERHDSQLRAHLAPIRAVLSSGSRSLQKVYWIAPPVSGRYSATIQDFLVEKLTIAGDHLWQVIDTRQLIRFPYRGLLSDREHFIGADMTSWGDQVYERLAQEIPHLRPELPHHSPVTAPSSVQPIAPPPASSSPTTLPPTPPLEADLPKSAPPREVAKLKTPKAPAVAPAHNEQTERKTLSVKVTLLRKSPSLALSQILPYQESMVAYLYRVDEVLRGSYDAPEILVMHPAHIQLQDQPLSKFKTSRSYSLELIDLEGSVWESVKKSDRLERPELLPYILVDDEKRSPLLNR